MFPVGRYDPKKKDHNNSNGGGNPKGNKRRRRKGPNKNGAAKDDDRDSEQPKSSLLRVIAPDETANLPFASSRMAQTEAVDDFALFPLLDSSSADIDESDVIEVDDVAMVGTTALAVTTTSTPTIGDGAGDDSDDDDHDDDHQTMTMQNNKAVSVGQASPGEIKAALKIASLGLEHAAKIWKLAPFLVNNLKRDGFQHFFPIQALSIPDVIASERHYHVQAQDVCITAPTGSGKTLAFVLPVLNALADRQVCRLRALIVLPSRDLANQVYRVFESYVQGSNLKVGLAIGQSDFTAEQVALTVGGDYDDDDNDQDKHNNKFDPSDALQRLRFDPGNLELTLRAYRDADSPAGGVSTGSSANNSNSSSSNNKKQALNSGQSAIDILVCTPGRLVDHLDNTKGFTLQHLRFLVVDEADRLLNQSYHNWIGRVIDAASEASVNAWHEIEARGDNRLAPVIPEQYNNNINNNSQVIVQDPITWRRGGTAGDYSDFDANANSYFCPASLACRPVQLRKFLVSATLTRDPQKLAALRLVNPKHFDVHQLNMLSSSAAGNSSDPNKSKQQRKQQFSVPIELEEFMVECTAEQKPIVLLSLLIEQLQKSESFMPFGDVESTNSTRNNNKRQNNVIVVFTASVDSTHRLARLLQLIWPSCTKLQEIGGNDEPDGLLGAVVEFSSALSQAERSALIQRCNDNSSSSSSSSHGRDKNDISIVVCSDSMARGMDIEKCGTVINYDVPTLAKTYLHRVGRTARAGKSGVAISLLKSGQVSQFTRMRRLIHSPSAAQAGNSRNSSSIVPTMDISKSLVRQLVPMYRNCIRGLKDVLEAEENGELAHTEPLSEEYFETSSD